MADGFTTTFSRCALLKRVSGRGEVFLVSAWLTLNNCPMASLLESLTRKHRYVNDFFVLVQQAVKAQQYHAVQGPWVQEPWLGVK